MIRRRTFCFVLLLLATSGVAFAETTDVVNFDAAPYALARVDEASVITDTKGRFSVEFYVHNSSPRTIHEVGIRAAVFAKGGESLKGYYVFTMPVRVAPGDTQYVLYTTSDYKAAPGDRAVLLPVSAKGTGVQWRQRGDIETDAMKSLERGRGDASSIESIWAADNQGPIPGIEGPPTGDCRSLCSDDRTRCESSCSCGMASHSCSCSGEGLSVTCTCNQC